MNRAAGVVGFGTLCSRIFGFIRDLVIAGFFGAGLASDAFFVAFRIPNLLRRLFAEGSLTVAFIPVFTRYLISDGKEEAFRLARNAIIILSCILIFISLLGIFAAPLIVKCIAPGFGEDPEKTKLCISLMRIVFPYIFFIGLVALSMGILNALGSFAAPAFAPVFLNIAMIVSILIAEYVKIEPVYALAYGVIAGGILQLALQIPFLLRNGIKLKAEIKDMFPLHPGIKKTGKLMLRCGKQLKQS